MSLSDRHITPRVPARVETRQTGRKAHTNASKVECLGSKSLLLAERSECGARMKELSCVACASRRESSYHQRAAHDGGLAADIEIGRAHV